MVLVLHVYEYVKEGSQKTLAYTEKNNCVFFFPCPNLVRLALHQGVGDSRGSTAVKSGVVKMQFQPRSHHHRKVILGTLNPADLSPGL